MVFRIPFYRGTLRRHYDIVTDTFTWCRPQLIVRIGRRTNLQRVIHGIGKTRWIPWLIWAFDLPREMTCR